ncbi:membrane protein [Morganella phage vB_Mm5]
METLKINKNSWHYKYLLFCKDKNAGKIKHNLCGYFWQFVGHAVGHVIGLAIILGFCGAIASPITAHFSISDWWCIPIGVVMLATLILVVGLIIFSCVYSKEKYDDYKLEKQYKREQLGLPEKQPNFITAWFRAFKKKHCPLIEFTDN